MQRVRKHAYKHSSYSSAGSEGRSPQNKRTKKGGNGAEKDANLSTPQNSNTQNPLVGPNYTNLSVRKYPSPVKSPSSEYNNLPDLWICMSKDCSFQSETLEQYFEHYKIKHPQENPLGEETNEEHEKTGLSDDEVKTEEKIIADLIEECIKHHDNKLWVCYFLNCNKGNIQWEHKSKLIRHIESAHTRLKRNDLKILCLFEKCNKGRSGKPAILPNGRKYMINHLTSQHKIEKKVAEEMWNNKPRNKKK